MYQGDVILLKGKYKNKSRGLTSKRKIETMEDQTQNITRHTLRNVILFTENPKLWLS